MSKELHIVEVRGVSFLVHDELMGTEEVEAMRDAVVRLDTALEAGVVTSWNQRKDNPFWFVYCIPSNRSRAFSAPAHLVGQHLEVKS